MMRGIRSFAIGIGATAIAAIMFVACSGHPLDPTAKPHGTGKVEICHIPPGNPDNAHTINISVNALPAHLAHGDSEGACGAAFGACCDASGCTDASEVDCDAVGGTFKGDGTSCSDVPDPCSIDGACCDGTTCSEETEADCNATGFDYKGDGTSCSDVPAPCDPPPPTGACCDGTTCSEETEADCNATGFDYKGDGTSCSDVPAPCAPPVPVGACCAESGCSSETEVDCESSGGVYRGDTSKCSDTDACVDTICHIPPGNPGNAKTKQINAWETSGHLGHGDTLGACP